MRTLGSARTITGIVDTLGVLAVITWALALALAIAWRCFR